MLGIQPKFQTCEKQKNRENKTAKVKQSHAQDSIYVVRQFVGDVYLAFPGAFSKTTLATLSLKVDVNFINSIKLSLFF